MTLTIKQREIANELLNKYTCITKLDAMKEMKKLYGDLATLSDIIIAYNYCEF